MHIFLVIGCSTWIWSFHQRSFPILATSAVFLCNNVSLRATGKMEWKKRGPLLLFNPFWPCTAKTSLCRDAGFCPFLIFFEALCSKLNYCCFPEQSAFSSWFHLFNFLLQKTRWLGGFLNSAVIFHPEIRPRKEDYVFFAIVKIAPLPPGSIPASPLSLSVFLLSVW